LTDAGTKAALFFIDSDSNVATAGDGGSSIDVLGKGNIYGARLISPLAIDASGTHLLLVGAEYKDFTESVFSENLVLTPISYLNLSFGNNSVWRADKTQWSLAMSANFGVRDVANDTEEFRVKRALGVANYFLLRGDASFATALPLGLSMRLRADGQYAVDPIISNEQFSIAGARGVRGYLEAEVLGDIGVKGAFELALPRWRPGAMFDIDTFAFFDIGKASRIDPLRELISDKPVVIYGDLLERPNTTLRSTGVGLNLSFTSYLQGSFAWAYPLADSAVADGTKTGDSRIHFSVQATF